MSLIELKNVEKTYDLGNVKVKALKGVNLELFKGDFLVIMGPSGSGKSTLVNLIGCLDIPTKGTIKLYNKDISHLEESDLAQFRGRKIGFVFQKFNLIPSLSALENVMLPLMFHGYGLNERKKIATELFEKVDLVDRMHHKPNELSGGQQQRVSIARALATNPEIILADEPTGNLDSKTGKQVMKILQDLHNEGKTIIFVTHDPRFISYGTKSVWLEDGMIVNNGKQHFSQTDKF